MAIELLKKDEWEVDCVFAFGERWWKGQHLTNILGYTDRDGAIRRLVDKQDRKTFSELCPGRDPIRIREYNDGTVESTAPSNTAVQAKSIYHNLVQLQILKS